MKKLLTALYLAVFIAPISLAAEASHLELIGFSRNGAYVAFHQFGIHDGRGTPYMYTSFVSVKSNRLEAEIKTEVDLEGATVAQARAKAKLMSEAAMKKYGIVSGNQGRFIGVTPPHMYTTISEFFALDRTYGLSIATKPAISTVEYCIEAPQLLIVKLMVSGKTRDLQRDTKLPASRDCAYGYEMRSAHLYGRSLAVFVSYQTVGFEGADSRWMVITGML
jgi:predicted secreted protein